MVTEIACIDRNHQTVVDFTVQVCNWLDKQDWVLEYGLFDFQRKVADDFVSPAAQLMDGNGNLTDLGKMYVHQQPMAAPGKAGASIKAFAVESVAGDQAQDGAQTGHPLLHEGETPNGGADHGEVQLMSVNAAAALSPDQQNALNAHNNKRKAKGVSPLAWDAQLAKNATAYAQHLAQIGKMEHSSGDQRPNQGENLAWASPAGATPLAMAANMWLDEEKNYHGEPIGQGNFGSYGHYSQSFLHLILGRRRGY